jgi:hypothetical protein
MQYGHASKRCIELKNSVFCSVLYRGLLLVLSVKDEFSPKFYRIKIALKIAQNCINQAHFGGFSLPTLCNFYLHLFSGSVPAIEDAEVCISRFKLG